MKKSWNIIFNKFNIINNETTQEIIENIYNNQTIFPDIQNIFKCFDYFELEDTKIVIVGQDPYHGANQATGLCFGINNNTKIPPSLKNIAKELKNDLNIELNDYTLENWAKQGILLLNSSLTVAQGKPGSHIKKWNKFTSFIIDELNKLNTPIIFVAWGSFAHNKLKDINLEKHKLIVSSHPSPLSVYKQYKSYPAFNESKPFSKINNLLLQNNKIEINW